MAHLQQETKSGAAPTVQPHTARLAVDDELTDAQLDNVTGGTTTGSNVMKSGADTQNGIVSNIKAS